MPLPSIDVGVMMIVIDNNYKNIDNSDIDIHIDDIHIDNRRHTFFISFVDFYIFVFLYGLCCLFIFIYIGNCKRTKKSVTYCT